MTTQATPQKTTATQTPTAMSPDAALVGMLTGYWISQALYVATKLGIPDLLKDKAKTSVELAAACDAHAPSLYRLLRMLAGVGVFAEDDAQRFTLTPISTMLLAGPNSMRAMTLHLGEAPTWRAWGELLHNVRTGQTAFQHAHGAEVFPYYAAHPESNSVFNEAMTNYSEYLGAAVIKAYDFSRFNRIVDVGGGHGSLIASILKANPEASGVLFDLPAAVEGARDRLEAEKLTSRGEVRGGDFFDSVPEGGDAYILKHIIHDWDEERAGLILKNVHRAMAEGGTLLLIETVITPGELPHGKLDDMHMMVMTGGRGRTEAEYKALLEAAGFKLRKVLQTESLVNVIEAVKA